jgi:DNA-binding NarL/FixJ family response regulator
MIRILLAEDHSLARIALHSVIDVQPDMEIVEETADGVRAVELYRNLRPDVAIVDLRLPLRGGHSVLNEIREFDRNARILVLTNCDGSEDVYQALQAGALAYLLKDTRADELITAIRCVFKGKRYVPPAVATRLAERIPVEELTVRELEVLRLIAKGLSNRGIAEELSIAEKTVRTHTSSILEKLGVPDRTNAAIAAIQRGIVHLA